MEEGDWVWVINFAFCQQDLLGKSYWKKATEKENCPCVTLENHIGIRKTKEEKIKGFFFFFSYIANPMFIEA